MAWRASKSGGGLLASQGGTEVPGGVVVVDGYRGRHPLVVWLTLALSSVVNPYAASHKTRDIVLLDETRSHELYREGPYSRITADTALMRLLPEIKRLGTEEFVRQRRVENATLGPVSVSVNRVGWFSVLGPALYWFKWIFSRRKKGQL